MGKNQAMDNKDLDTVRHMIEYPKNNTHLEAIEVK